MYNKAEVKMHFLVSQQVFTEGYLNLYLNFKLFEELYITNSFPCFKKNLHCVPDTCDNLPQDYNLYIVTDDLFV